MVKARSSRGRASPCLAADFSPIPAVSSDRASCIERSASVAARRPVIRMAYVPDARPGPGLIARTYDPLSSATISIRSAPSRVIAD